MKKFSVITILFLCAFVFVAILVPIEAVAIPTNYYYVGALYDDVIDDTPPAGTYTLNQSLTFMFTLPDALAPNDFPGTVLPTYFSGFDGRFTFASDQSSPFSFKRFDIISTDASGLPSSWDILLEWESPNWPQVGETENKIWSTTLGNFVQRSESVFFNDSTKDYEERYDLASTLEKGTWQSAPVPEPTTMLLFGAGLVGLAGFGRKKFKK